MLRDMFTEDVTVCGRYVGYFQVQSFQQLDHDMIRPRQIDQTQRKPSPNLIPHLGNGFFEGVMRGGAYRGTGGSGGQEDGFPGSAAAPSVFLP